MRRDGCRPSRNFVAAADSLVGGPGRPAGRWAVGDRAGESTTCRSVSPPLTRLFRLHRAFRARKRSGGATRPEGDAGHGRARGGWFCCVHRNSPWTLFSFLRRLRRRTPPGALGTGTCLRTVHWAGPATALSRGRAAGLLPGWPPAAAPASGESWGAPNRLVGPPCRGGAVCVWPSKANGWYRV